MDLLLWRHAEAVDGADDMRRELTAHGQKQARATAKWIGEHRPKDMRIIVSPAVRTRQTAAMLKLPFEIVRKVGPDASIAELVAASGWPASSGSVLIVGHQPSLGRLASLLLTGHESDWTIKKGALWWLRNRTRQGETQTVLRAVIPAKPSGRLSSAH